MSRHSLSLLPVALVLLAACGDKDENADDTDDSVAPEHCPGDGDDDDDGVCNSQDCAPNDRWTFPGANEVPYDGVDNDCAGDGDLVDVDGDGYDGVNAGGDDCNDNNPTIHPNAEEICYDGLDQDCSGGQDTNDCDGDGFDGRGSTANDCDDRNPDIYPGQTEIWYDGVDGDCSDPLDQDADFDADGDGDRHADYGGTDCDDQDPLTAGTNPEIWDGVDRDCDGLIDNLDAGASLGYWNGDRGVNDGFLGMSGGLFEDWDGDGYRTIAMSGYDDENTRAGKVYFVDAGDADGNPHRVAVTTIQGAESEYLGMDMANIGDLDNDGYAELVVGAPVSGTGSGLVFRGSTLRNGGTIASSAAFASFSGNTYLGIDIAAVGDVDGDGVPDMAGGLGWLDNTHVMVYSGAAALRGGNMSPVQALAQIDAGSGGGLGGQTVGGLDYDGDGRSDLLVATSTTGSGVTTLVSGVVASQGNLVSTDDVPGIRGRTGNQVGITSGWLDDVDSNGYPEILVRAYAHNGAASAAGGRVFVVDGSEVLGSGRYYADEVAMYTVDGTVDNGHLQPAESGGDFDGDGAPDLVLVHAGDREMAWSLEGQTGVLPMAYVHFGPDVVSGGTVSATDTSMSIRGTNDDELMGYSTLTGDIDLDGLDDLVFGAPASSNTAGAFWALLSNLDGN